MSRAAGHAAPPGGAGFFMRLRYVWAGLAIEQRRVGVTALALWLTLALPWYHENAAKTSGNRIEATGYNVTGYGTFSFVEASLLLVSVAVLALLFYRGEQRAFHLPGGDGFVIMLAGGWQSLLIFYRMLDTPHLTEHAGNIVTDAGVQWGMFVALFIALALTYGGARVRAAHRPEPRLADDPTVRHDVVVAAHEPPARVHEPPTRVTRRPPSRRVTREDAEQLSFDVPDGQQQLDPFGEH